MWQKEEWFSQWFSRSPVAGLGRPRTDGCGRETMTCHGYTIRINYEKPWKLVICCPIYNDILIGEVEISQFDDYGVYMYVYIYIVWPLYAMVFPSMNGNMMWYHAVYRNETHDEYHAPNIKTPQAYGPLNMCKFPYVQSMVSGGVEYSGDWTYHIFMSLA